MLNLVVNKLPRISSATSPQSHLRFTAPHCPFDNRVLCELPGREERHAGLEHVVVALAHHLGGLAVRAEVVPAVFVSVVVAFGLVLAILHGIVVGVAEADDELARRVVETVLVEA